MELFRLFGTILVDNEKANQSIAKTDKQASSSSNSISNSFKKIGTALVTAFSVAKIKQFGDACIEAYNVQKEAETKLETIMRQRMKSTDASIQSIKGYASELQNLGVVGDEVQLSGAQQLATFLNTEEALKTLMPAMNNLAVQQNGVNVSSQNMVSIGNLMGKVMQGQTGALTKVGISFTDAQEKVLKYGNEQERASMLAQVITDNVGNMNEVMAQTDDGKIQQAKNSFGDLQEKIGEVISPLKTGFYAILGDISTKLQNDVIPAFEDFCGWIDDNKEGLQDLAIILSPLIALFAAYQLMIHSGSIALGIYNTVTAISAVVTTGFGTAVAFVTSPIGIAIAVITGLIAVGVLLYRNWDTIKEKANELWQAIKSKFNSIYEAIKEPIDKAKKFIKDGIDAIKGFFNFKIEWPKIKMPHFNIKGSFNPIDWITQGVPKIGVEWYAKAMDKGMILDKPTIFGSQNGKLLGAGEAGSETVVGTQSLMEMINNASNAGNSDLLNVLLQIRDYLSDEDRWYRIMLKALTDGSFTIVLDGREVGRIVKKYA